MKPKRRLKGYQHLSASGHLSAVLEGEHVFNELKSGIKTTKDLFVFLDTHIELLDMENTERVSFQDWLELKRVISDYAQKHTSIDRSQTLFVLTVLRGIDEAGHLLRATTAESIKKDAGERDALDYWFMESEAYRWLKHLIELFRVGRKLREKSPIMREHLWALAGRALKHIIIPFYHLGRDIEEEGWWQYFVQHGWVTPLCHIRHPYDATHAEEWRKGMISAISERTEVP